MSAPQRNPYTISDPDVEARFVGRPRVRTRLEGALLYTEDPNCVSVIAERYIGGEAVVRSLARSPEVQQVFRIIECDVMSDLSTGTSAADFYRALVHLVAAQLPVLPADALRHAERLQHNTSHVLGDIRADLFGFFEGVRRLEVQRPLLIILYRFDRLPSRYPFSGDDWAYLRLLHEESETRVFYVVVSRRALSFVEQLHHLQHSNFASRFNVEIRVGLLEAAEARKLAIEPGCKVIGADPWAPWVTDAILAWSGGHPYLVEVIGHTVFAYYWQEGNTLEHTDENRLLLRQRAAEHLQAIFSRLYDNLEEDGLLQVIGHALEHGHSADLRRELELLENLGYFPSGAVQKRQYQLFSPLFHDYLAEREVVRPALPTVSQPATPPNPPPRPSQSGCDPDKLTPRELEVLQLAASGKTDEQIANSLVLSHHTVVDHMKNIRAKLQVTNRTGAIAQAWKRGLISP